MPFQYSKSRLTLVLTTFTLFYISPTRAWVPKRTNEDSSYFYSPPHYTFQRETEPSCSELRAIWRLTKRAAQQSILTNHIQPEIDGAEYGYLVHTPTILDVKPSRGYKPRQSYGKVLIQPNQPKSGAFDKVAEQLKTDDAARLKSRTRPIYGHEPRPAVFAPLDPDYDYTITGNSRSDWEKGVVEKDQAKTFPTGFVKAPISAIEPSRYRSYKEGRENLAITENSCADIVNKKCRTDDDCTCNEAYTCSSGRCQSGGVTGKVKYNIWDNNNNNVHDWQKQPPLIPSDFLLKNKDGRRKNLRRTDRKKVGAYPEYYSKHNHNSWT